MEQKLRRAVLDRLNIVGERAGSAEAGSLVPMARTEIRRLTSGWRELLASHQPDDKGRCPKCSGWLRRRRWPCPVWLAAHHHLIGESLSKNQRSNNPRKALASAAKRNPTVVIPRRLPADHPANQRPAQPAADRTLPAIPAVS
jgi:hypothetical protein